MPQPLYPPGKESRYDLEGVYVVPRAEIYAMWGKKFDIFAISKIAVTRPNISDITLPLLPHIGQNCRVPFLSQY